VATKSPKNTNRLRQKLLLTGAGAFIYGSVTNIRTGTVYRFLFGFV
jgi:hypothetical protein